MSGGSGNRAAVPTTEGGAAPRPMVAPCVLRVGAAYPDPPFDVPGEPPSGTTVTDHRQTLAMFCRPCVRLGQSLVVDAGRDLGVRSVGDLAGRSIGVQRGNTSEPLAHRLQSEGKVASVRTYPYRDILVALDDLKAGRIGAFIKLEVTRGSPPRSRRWPRMAGSSAASSSAVPASA